MKSANITVLLLLAVSTSAPGATGIFTPDDRELVLTAQKVFIHWDPNIKEETLVIQVRVEGNASHFALVIPTPGIPKTDRENENFFRGLAAFTVLKKWDGPAPGQTRATYGGIAPIARDIPSQPSDQTGSSTARDLGVVQPATFATVSRTQLPQRLEQSGWSLSNKTFFIRDANEALDAYQDWSFTVVTIKGINQLQERYTCEIAPVRLKFQSERPIYPAKLARLVASKSGVDVLFHLNYQEKTDLEGDLTYEFRWVPILRTAYASTGPVKLPNDDPVRKFLSGVEPNYKELIQQPSLRLGYYRPQGELPHVRGKIADDGRRPTDLVYAKKLTADDLGVLDDTSRYSVPRNGSKSGLVREASVDDIAAMKSLKGRLHEGNWLTSFHKVFLAPELKQDVAIVSPTVGRIQDHTEYFIKLPGSP